MKLRKIEKLVKFGIVEEGRVEEVRFVNLGFIGIILIYKNYF